MTRLKSQVSRQTNAIIHEAGKPREIIVILTPPNLVGFRAKGCRKTYTITTEAGYCMAVKAEVAAVKREKQKARAERRAKR